MKPPLEVDIWMTCGISLLWDAHSLRRLCDADRVRSVRDLLRLSQADWSEEELKLVNDRAMVVAGLDAAMDAMSPTQATEWLEDIFYPVVRDFQLRVADGGNEAALVLWLADAKRIHHNAADDTYHWRCAGEHHGETIPLGRCIWNGAQDSVRRIMVAGPESKPAWVGLFHPRIS